MQKIREFFDLMMYKLRNLSRKQWTTIIAIAAAVVAVIVIIVVVVSLISSGAFSGNNTSGGASGNGGADGDTGNSSDPGEVTNFYISSPPSNVEYFVNDEPDYTGLAFYVSRNTSGIINYTDDPDAFTITGFDSSEAVEEQVITVEYEGWTDTFTVTIQERSVGETRVLESIELESSIRTKYRLGDALMVTGSYIVANYSDATTERVELTRENIPDFYEVNTPGTHELTIEYFDPYGGYAEMKIEFTFVE